MNNVVHQRTTQYILGQHLSANKEITADKWSRYAGNVKYLALT